MINPGIDRNRISPEFLMHLSDPLEALYESLERDLIINIARRFRAVPKGMQTGTDAWRLYMLEQIGGLTRQNMLRIAALTGDAANGTVQALEQAIGAALNMAEPGLQAMTNRPDYVPARSDTARRVMEHLSAQAIDRLNMVNTTMLNTSLDAYRDAVGDVTAAVQKYESKLADAQQTLNTAAGQTAMGTQSRKTAVWDAVRRMASNGLTGFYDRSGRRWSAQAYVQMDVRTTAANAAREAVMARNADYGNNLIMVSSHPGARPLCAPYQGKVYSTDGTSGTVEDLKGRKVQYTPLSATSYGEPGGLFGINCGHMPSPFIPGQSINRAAEYDPDDTKRLYAESQMQRQMERKIRALKTEAAAVKAAGGDASKETKAARQATAELQAWCEANNRDFYPERVQIVR